MLRGDEAAGLNKFCQHGITTGKITFSSPTVLAQGELQDFSQSVQRAEARPRGFSGPTLVAHFQATIRPLIEEIVTTDPYKEGYGGHMNSLSFQGRWPAKKSKNAYINIQELETV